MALQKFNYYYYYYFTFKPTSTKPQARQLKLNNVNGCNDDSCGVHCVLEGDRISPLESYGRVLEQELLLFINTDPR